MSTSFFWDRNKKKFICERRAVGLEGKNFGKELTYIFENPEVLIEFLKTDRDVIIIDEYDTFWTIDSLKEEILNKGCIIFVNDYYNIK